jgi:hypothetical protein
LRPTDGDLRRLSPLANRERSLVSNGPTDNNRGEQAMAHFRLGFNRLYPHTRLYVNGNSGTERLVLHTGKQVTLEIAGLAGASVKPKIIPSVAGKVTISTPSATNNATIRKFTVKATGSGKTVLSATDDAGNALTTGADLEVIAGDFLNHTGMDEDLVAKAFQGGDAGKMHALIRMLFNSDDNIFNELSDANQRQWCRLPDGRPDPNGCLPCGTVAKVGGWKLYDPNLKYTYHSYHQQLAGMRDAAKRAALKRDDVKMNNDRLKEGRKAIHERLKKGIPSVVGVVYIPATAMQPSGTFNVTDSGGHTVLIVGCSADEKKFLYIDPYPKGSKLKYAGGVAGHTAFPNCDYLGLFEFQPASRGTSDVLRSTTPGDSGIFSGDQFLEVVSGPVTLTGPSTEKAKP